MASASIDLRPPSPAPSSDSLRSDNSKIQPPTFSTSRPKESSASSSVSRSSDAFKGEKLRPPSPAPSSDSLRSDNSKIQPPTFSTSRPKESSASSSVSRSSDASKGEKLRPPSPAPSSDSLRSDNSKIQPPTFSTSRPKESSASSSVSRSSDASKGEKLRPPSPAPSSDSLRSDNSKIQPPTFSTSRPKESSASSSVSRSSDASKGEKLSLNKREEKEKPASQGDSAKDLEKKTEKSKNEVKNELDTEIYEKKRDTVLKNLDDLFKHGRTVLTTGVAGIGKTFQATKYVQDWAGPKAGKPILLDFEEFNSEKSKNSIVALLNPSVGTIVLDGLDKCQLPLDFKNNQKLTDISAEAPVDELLTNLIQGNLLPSARLWILTRPSGQNKIPEQYIHRVTQCRETVERQKRLLSNLKERLNKETQSTNKSNEKKKDSEHVLLSSAANPEKIKSLKDLFKADKGERLRTVLTVAQTGLDKSFHVQQFIQDWAKKGSTFGGFMSTFTSWWGKNEIVLLFPLKGSEVRLQKELSFVGLLNKFFKETEQFVMSDYTKLSCVFILDGLEDFKLDWTKEDRVSDVYEAAPVTVLLSSLIRGDLLPSALVWITSSPAAADQVPPDLLHRTTHIRDKNVKDELSKQLKEKIKKNGKRDELETELCENKSASKQQIHFLLSRPKVRTVLTTGVPQIGKTFHSENFRLDWAKGKFEKDTDFVLSIPFAALNQSTDKSLQALLNEYLNCGKSKGCYYNEYKIIIILDGLDKCQLPLDFENQKKLTDISAEAPVDELLTNLIQGNLLPSARLWILTRPSGQNKIPEQYIHTVSQCRETEKRRQMLISKLKESFSTTFVFEEDPSHPNQKDTEHIRPDRVYSNGRKQQITISDLFKKEDKDIRTVLTTGEADVGKSYLVRKFIHNWATPGYRWPFSTKKETSLLFPLEVSQLNKLTNSFVKVLNEVFKETEQCVMSDYTKLSCVFILDGLEDFKLDWTEEDRVSDVNEAAPVTVLLSSLIRGDLLPSALVWITSRPAAAEHVPPDLLHRTTHIREKPDVVSQRNLKKVLIKQYERVAEGVDRGTAAASLKDIYTDLYIIEGEAAEVFQQSETRLVQRGKDIEVRKEIPINYQDIFKASAERPNGFIKTVLTTGVAGIGKTFASMKYMLDWAEETSSHNINMTFPLPFRELNLRKDKELSLEDLLYEFFPCMRTSEITDYQQYKVLIVLDGLDECRPALNFHQTQEVSDIKEKSTVNNLLTNLIVGNLLPKAQVWITSRPAASLCIPADKVERVTEVRGFNDEKKEEYFRKRFDLDLAEKILCYVKESRCIYLMCYIPVFCWITAKVLESFVQNNHQGIPKTLTDLFIHFLLLQCRQANAKYNEATEEGSKTWNERNVNCILGLSKMAFKELVKGKLLFSEEDLRSYGLDVEEAAVYSGLLTKIERDESEIYPKLFFSFVHLSIQEFLAAFYVLHTFNDKGTNVFSPSTSSDQSAPDQSTSVQSASDFYKSVVDEALKSKNGDWDLFLRFLLGLSLKTNQNLLKGVLKMPENIEETNKETIAYVKTKINEEHSDSDMSMNLFHCLNELNDHSLVEEIKKYLVSEKNDFENFSPSKWSALTFVLLTSDQNLDVFDLKKYLKSEKVLLGMMPVVKVSKTALLSWCGLSELSGGALSSILMSSSNLTELDLSHNELMDSGIEKLSGGLKSHQCKLKILRLAGCRVSEKGCSFLISALKSNKSSPLEVLDLSYNHPGPEGETLKTLETDPNVKLKEVCLDHCCEHRLKPGLRKYTADLTFDANLKHRKIIIQNQTAVIREKASETIPEASGAVSVRHVFCEQELSGPCFWELEWDGTVGVGVCYKGAATKCVLGSDERSWGVFCSNQPNSCLEFTKCAAQAHTPKKPHRKKRKFPSQKMAVYLDWHAGTLSYYSVPAEGEPTLVTTFKAKFKQPLVPTFWLHYGSVTLC